MPPLRIVHFVNLSLHRWFVRRRSVIVVVCRRRVIERGRWLFLSGLSAVGLTFFLMETLSSFCQGGPLRSPLPTSNRQGFHHVSFEVCLLCKTQRLRPFKVASCDLLVLYRMCLANYPPGVKLSSSEGERSHTQREEGERRHLNWK